MRAAKKLVRMVSEGRAVERVLEQLFPRAIRSLKRPTIGNFLESAGQATFSPCELLDNLVGLDWRSAGYESEYRELSAELEVRYSHVALPQAYNPTSRVESQSSFVLYSWTRHKKPKVVLETGVLNGHSSAIFLAALRKNGCGELHSTDIFPDVGALLTPEERDVWHFHLLPANSSRRVFQELVAKIRPIDLFFHDSMHSYDWQMVEYHAVFPNLGQDALFASDDIDGNFAFLDFTQSVSAKPSVLLGENKLVGFLMS